MSNRHDSNRDIIGSSDYHDPPSGSEREAVLPTTIGHGPQLGKSFLVVAIAVVLRVSLSTLLEKGITAKGTGMTSSEQMLREEFLMTSQTPLTSYSSLQEAQALIQHRGSRMQSIFSSTSFRSISPYVSDAVRVPPLILYVLDAFGCLESKTRQFYLLLSIEVLTAIILALTVSRLQHQRDTRIDLSIHIQRQEHGDTSISVGHTGDTQHPDVGLDQTNGLKQQQTWSAASSSSPSSSPKQWFVDQSSEFSQPWMIMAVYLFNPIHVCASFSLSLDPLRLFFLSALFLVSVSASSMVWCPVCLACFAYLIPLPSAVALGVCAGHASAAVQRSRQTSKKNPFSIFYPVTVLDYVTHYWLLNTIPLLLLTAIGFYGLHQFSFFLMGSWDYWDSCVTAVFTIRDLTPNLGIFWYPIQLVYPPGYKSLYLAAYHLTSVILCMSLSLKFIRQPLGLMQVLISTVLMFHPYPTMIDFSFIIILLSIDVSVMRRVKIFTLWVSIMCFMLAVFPIFANLWLRRNTANANYVYGAQIGCTATTSVLISEFAKESIKLHTGDDEIFVELVTPKEAEYKPKQD